MPTKVQLSLSKGVNEVLPVANGGTGATNADSARAALGALGTNDTISKATSLNGGVAGNLVYQSAPNTTAFVSNGISGQLLQSNGSGAPSFVTFSGGFTNIAVFTASSSWTVPVGVTKCKVTVVAGGGGGGVVLAAGGGQWFTGAPGAGGGTSIKLVTELTPGGTVAVTVGAAGIAPGNGTGGTSSFGAYCSATGGSAWNLPGAGTGGDINLRGGCGMFPSIQNGQYYNSSFGGSSYFGGMYLSSQTINFGQGGQGGVGNDAAQGTNGGPGIVIIEY